VSLDAASAESYTQYRIGGNFDKVISNVRRLVAAKRRLHNNYTRIVLLFHVFRHNEHELDDFIALARDLGVEYRINRMRTDMAKEIFEQVSESIERDAQWIPESDKYSAFDLEKRDKRQQMVCRELWKTAVINWDGSVLPCCAVYGERYAFGNVTQEPFDVIWNNEKYRLARKEVRNRVSNSPTICHICRQQGYLHF
jgi:radical SAM protein with 4Fe4S-binding SPASM domain